MKKIPNYILDLLLVINLLLIGILLIRGVWGLLYPDLFTENNQFRKTSGIVVWILFQLTYIMLVDFVKEHKRLKFWLLLVILMEFLRLPILISPEVNSIFYFIYKGLSPFFIIFTYAFFFSSILLKKYRSYPLVRSLRPSAIAALANLSFSIAVSSTIVAIREFWEVEVPVYGFISISMAVPCVFFISYFVKVKKLPDYNQLTDHPPTIES